jgi:translation initiation factor 1A
MPANKKGGKKFKRGKKDNYGDRKLILKDSKEGQEYAQIKKVNGSGRYVLMCFDGTERLGIAAGNIRKKTRINLYDVILVSLWDFQDSKCSIIHKYEDDEVKKLKTQGEFPVNLKLEGEQTSDFFDDESIQFDYELPGGEENEDDSESDDDSDSDSEKKTKKLVFRHNEGGSVIDFDDI